MSLILDALRKMELERKAKRLKSQEIRAEVLHYRGSAPVADNPRTVSVTVALLLVFATAAAVFYFTELQSSKIVPPSQGEALHPVTPPAIPALTLPPPPIELPPQKNSQNGANRGIKTAKTAADSAMTTQNSGAAGLTVSGIAWQEERPLRRAVINGALVGEGAEIQGAKIVEIKENRVRFSRGGEIFEVVHASGTGN